MGFDGKMEVTTLEGQEQTVSQGPVAAIVLSSSWVRMAVVTSA